MNSLSILFLCAVSVSSGPYQPVPKPHVTVTPIMGPPFTTRMPQEMSVSDFCAQQPKLGPFRAPTVPTKSFQENASLDHNDGPFSLQNIKLPPGITITKVSVHIFTPNKYSFAENFELKKMLDGMIIVTLRNVK
jgi:hypothetical protein